MGGGGQPRPQRPAAVPPGPGGVLLPAGTPELLAHELEKTHAHGVDRVRVVHISPHDNDAYQSSLVRPEHRALGGTFGEVWQQLLVRRDRFLSVGSAHFLDPEITSADYAERYGTA